VEEINRTESDHIPLKVELIEPQTKKKIDKKSLVKIKRSDWTEEGVKSYQKNCRE